MRYASHDQTFSWWCWWCMMILGCLYNLSSTLCLCLLGVDLPFCLGSLFDSFSSSSTCTLEFLILSFQSQSNLMPSRSFFPRNLPQSHGSISRRTECEFDLERLEFSYSSACSLWRIGYKAYRRDHSLPGDSHLGSYPRLIGLGRYRGRYMIRGTRRMFWVNGWFCGMIQEESIHYLSAPCATGTGDDWHTVDPSASSLDPTHPPWGSWYTIPQYLQLDNRYSNLVMAWLHHESYSFHLQYPLQWAAWLLEKMKFGVMVSILLLIRPLSISSIFDEVGNLWLTNFVICWFICEY